MSAQISGLVQKVQEGTRKAKDKDVKWQFVNIGGLTFWSDSYSPLPALPEVGQRISATIENNPYKSGDKWVDKLQITDWQAI